MTGKRDFCPGCGFILLPEPWLGKYRCANCRDGTREPVFQPFGPRVVTQVTSADEEAA